MAYRKKALLIYMTEEEYEFLKEAANRCQRTLSQTLLYMADMATRIKELKELKETPLPEEPIYRNVADMDDEDY